MLTPDTQIPTSYRSQVRSLVKAHKDWPAYLTEKDIISARAKNADLLEFARMHPELAAEVAQVLNLQSAAPQLPAGWTPMRVYALAAAIEHMLQSFSEARQREAHRAEELMSFSQRTGKPRIHNRWR